MDNLGRLRLPAMLSDGMVLQRNASENLGMV